MNNWLVESTLINLINSGEPVNIGRISLLESWITALSPLDTESTNPQSVLFKISKNFMVGKSGKNPDDDVFVHCSQAYITEQNIPEGKKLVFESLFMRICKPDDEKAYRISLFIPSRLKTGLLLNSPGLLYKGVDSSLIEEVYTKDFPRINT